MAERLFGGDGTCSLRSRSLVPSGSSIASKGQLPLEHRAFNFPPLPIASSEPPGRRSILFRSSPHEPGRVLLRSDGTTILRRHERAQEQSASRLAFLSVCRYPHRLAREWVAPPPSALVRTDTAAETDPRIS